MSQRFSEKFPYAKKKSGSIYCSICDIVCSSQESLAMHIDGKKHKYFSAKAKNRKESTYCSVNNPLESTYCSICEVNFQNQNVLAAHIAGRKHKARLSLKHYDKNKSGLTSESLPSCKSDDTANKSDKERMQKKSSIKLEDMRPPIKREANMKGEDPKNERMQKKSSKKLEETRPPIKREANMKGEDPKNENVPQFESIQELQEFLTNYKIENEQDAAFAYETIRSISNLVLSYSNMRRIKQAKTPKVEPVSTFDNDNVLRSQEEEKQAETPKEEPVPTFYYENIFLRSQEEENQVETPKEEHVPTFDIGSFYGALNNKSEEEIKSSIQELTEILKQQLPSM